MALPEQLMFPAVLCQELTERSSTPFVLRVTSIKTKTYLRARQAQGLLYRHESVCEEYTAVYHCLGFPSEMTSVTTGHTLKPDFMGFT